MNCWRHNFLTLFSPLILLAGVLPSGPSVVYGTSWFSATPDFLEQDPISAAGSRRGWAIEQDGSVRRLFRDGELQGTEETQFSRNSAGEEVPRMVTRMDGDGVLQYRDEYRYRPDGTLRSLRRCFGDESCMIIRYAPPGEAGSEVIQGLDLDLRVRYNVVGVPEYLRREFPGEPAEEEWFTFADGRLIERRTERGNTQTVQTYEDSNQVSLVERRDGVVVYRLEQKFFPDGSLQERTVQTRQRREVERWIRTETGDYVRELRVNGVLVERDIPEADGLVVRERIQGGEVVFRSYRRDDELVRRETLLRGEVVRTETWDTTE